MENEKISIKTAAESIAHLLFIGAHSDATAIVRGVEALGLFGPDETRLGHVSIEMTHFYIHNVDRLVFQYVETKRDEFIDEVVIQVLKNNLETHKLAGGNEEQFFNFFKATHKKRQEEYAKYNDKSVKYETGNLYYEFESKIAEIVGAKDDSLVIMTVHGILMPNLGKFQEVCKKFILGISPEELIK